MNVKASWFVLLVLTLGVVYAESPVEFQDANLKAAVEDALFWVNDPTPSDMLDLTELRCIDQGVVNLEGLEYATNLQTLWLRLNHISDISPLASCTQLKVLNLSKNKLISDLSPLAGLTHLHSLNCHVNLISDLSFVKNMHELTTLVLRRNRVSDLTDLSGLVDLQYLYLGYNQIQDISPLAPLVNLTEFVIWGNQISDISAVSNMTKLQYLSIGYNQIGDISPLSSLSKLKKLSIIRNPIRDVSSLCGLHELENLFMTGLPLDTQAYTDDLYTICRNNPGLHIEYDPNPRSPEALVVCEHNSSDAIVLCWSRVANGPSYTSYYRVTRSSLSSPDRIAISPWQTQTYYVDHAVHAAETYTYQVQCAVSDEGDSAGQMSRPLVVENTVDSNALMRLYVDSEANDPLEAGTVDHPFSHIQDAISVAQSGTTIQVLPGRYHEGLDFLDKSLTLSGIDPAATEPNALAILDCNGLDVGLSFSHVEDSNCVVNGFELTGGGTVFDCQSSTPTLQHCLIVGNRITDPNRAVVQCHDSNVVLIQCTIADNLGTVLSLENSTVSLENSIYWQSPANSVMMDDPSVLRMDHTDNMEEWPGSGNLSLDPLFFQSGQWQGNDGNGWIWMEGDYHLQSAFGRWDRVLDQWEFDAQTSPCIGAGDPNLLSNQGNDPLESVNCGAYGGTLATSKGQSL